MISKSTIRLLHLTLCILFGSIISACSPIIKYEQPSRIERIKLSADANIGQTFLSRYRGLNGVEIFIKPDSITKGELLLYLYNNSMDTSKEIGLGSFPLERVSEPGYYRIPIPTIRDSFNKDYYLQVEIEGQNELNLAIAPGNYYLNGALYHNGIPQDSQLSFRLTYNPIHLYVGILLEVLHWIFMIFVACWLFIIPGWAILSLTFPDWMSQRVVVKFALSAGVSLAIYPIILLWTNLIGLQLGPLYARLPPIAGFLYILWRNRRTLIKFIYPTTRHKSISSFRLSALNYIKSPSDWLPDFLLLTILLLIIFTRFWVIRNLDAPMWGDSYQHTMIAQLLVENNGLFNSWAPYADLTTFTYHFGFHILVASYHWLTGISMTQAVMWTGQVLNVFAVLSIYPIAIQVGRTRWAGIIAMLIAGLLLAMPMFYVNWGRYTQLTGNILLATFASLALTTLGTKTSRLIVGILLGLVLAGLALTHYRILILALLFFPAYLIVLGKEFDWKSILINILIIGLVGGLLFLPWFIHVFVGKIIQIFTNQMTNFPSESSGSSIQTNIFANILDFLPAYVWLLLPIVISIGLWKREKGVALISLWWYLIFMITNPHWIGLPGYGAITNFTILIAVYIPASILIGYAGGRFFYSLIKSQTTPCADRSFYRLSSIYLISLTILVLSLGVWGSQQRLQDVQPYKHGLVTRPDIRAADWIQENSQENERFLVSSFFAFNDTVIVGSDAGWWLPILAGRNINVPPINYAFEEGTRPDFQEWINALNNEIQSKGINHPDVLIELANRGIKKIYLGQQSGSVNYSGPQMLDSEDLLASPNYQPIYHQDQVWIFSVVQ